MKTFINIIASTVGGALIGGFFGLVSATFAYLLLRGEYFPVTLISSFAFLVGVIGFVVGISDEN